MFQWNSPAAITLSLHRSLLHLTHWGWVTHICISKLSIIGSDNGVSPGRLQAIIWTNAGILLIGPLGTNFIEILIEILTFPKCVWMWRVRNGVYFVSASMCNVPWNWLIGVRWKLWLKFLSSTLLMHFRQHENILAFLIIPEHWEGTDSWNQSTWKTRTHLSCIVNTMVADDLATAGARSSATIVLT